MKFTTKNTESLHNEIYKLVKPKDIFMYYFPFEERKMYNSPFRKDPDPSFNIVNKDGNWFFNDFGYRGGDAVKFVELLFGLNYYGACNKIKKDFGLSDVKIDELQQIDSSIEIEKEKKEFNITFTPRPFTDLELDYWKQFDISKADLEKEEIFAAKKLWYNDKEVYLSDKILRFIYRYTNDGENFKKKIYTPESEDFKWIGSISQKHIEGINQLPFKNESVIIQKSRKDRVVMKKIHEDVINTQNENFKCITPELTRFLDKHYRYKYIFWDSDSVGVEECKKLNEKGYLYLNIPKKIYEETGCKDVSDIIKHFGTEEGYAIIALEMMKKGISLN